MGLAYKAGWVYCHFTNCCDNGFMQRQQEKTVGKSARCENTVLNPDYKSCTIFLNTKCTSEDIPDEIRQFFNFVNENEVGDDPMYEILSRRMTALNEWNNPWRRDVMRLDQEFHRAERKAMEKGMAEGLAKGAREQCIIIAKEMLKDGMKPEKAAELTKLTMKEVEALIKN